MSADNLRLVLLLGAGTIFTFIWLCCFRDRLKMKWYAALPISILHTVCGVLSVKAFAIIEGFGDLSVVGNMSLFGGIFFMPIFYYLGAKLTKRKAADVFDVFTIGMIFTVMCARINCIFSGCCGGKAIPFAAFEGLHWPTREMEVIFYIILLIILGRKILKGESKGKIYPIYMISYGIFRFIIESFRTANSPLGYIHLAHIWALITLGLGLSIYSEIKSRKKKERR